MRQTWVLLARKVPGAQLSISYVAPYTPDPSQKTNTKNKIETICPYLLSQARYLSLYTWVCMKKAFFSFPWLWFCFTWDMFIQHKSSESQDLFIYFHMYGKYLSLMATWNRMLEQSTSWVYRHGTCDRRNKAWNCSSEVPSALLQKGVVDVFLVSANCSCFFGKIRK